MVYADNDPVIHAHANALLTGAGASRDFLADLRDPGVILAGARDFLDVTKPVVLLLVAILHFIPDADSGVRRPRKPNATVISARVCQEGWVMEQATVAAYSYWLLGPAFCRRLPPEGA